MTNSRAEATPSNENLSLLYQGMLTAIVRIQSGRQPLVDADALQKRMDSLLAEIAREAIKLGYPDTDIEDANCAVLAFLDETVQRSLDPKRSRWTPMRTRMAAHSTGDGFFERLDKIQERDDSAELADLLEVYCLCLLLGYEGDPRRGRSTLSTLLRDLPVRIHRIRGTQPYLSPEGAAPATQQSLPVPRRQPNVWRWLAVVCLILAGSSWIGLNLWQRSDAQQIVREVTAR